MTENKILRIFRLPGGAGQTPPGQPGTGPRQNPDVKEQPRTPPRRRHITRAAVVRRTPAGFNACVVYCHINTIQSSKIITKRNSAVRRLKSVSRSAGPRPGEPQQYQGIQVTWIMDISQAILQMIVSAGHRPALRKTTPSSRSTPSGKRRCRPLCSRFRGRRPQCGWAWTWSRL